MKAFSPLPLLPTLMAACAIVLLTRLAGVLPPLFEAVAATEPDQDSDPAPSDAVDGEQNSSSCASDSPDDVLAHDSGLSKQEIQVLRSLSARRQELDRRATDIETRVTVAEAAELRLGEQISRLKKVQKDVTSQLDAMQILRDERLDGLVKVYESMKPKDAARIFDALDAEVLIRVGVRMKHASLAAIMAKMNADRARFLTHRLADADTSSHSG